MLTSTAQLGLSRRVVAIYLLCSSAAIVLVACGTGFGVQSLLRSQTTGSALSHVGRLAAAVELDQRHHSGERTAQLVLEARTEGRLESCSVVGEDGRFVAHTDETLVGAVAVEAVGAQLRWGEIDGVRYRDVNDRLVSEYSAPLKLGDGQTGSLRLAVVEPGFFGTLFELARYAPLAVVAPLTLVGAGGIWLRRLAKPVSGLEAQLVAVARQPHGEPPRLEPTAASGAAAVGWNRVVDRLQSNHASTDSGELDSKLQRLAAAASGGRTAEALESLTEGVAVTDAEGLINFANRAVAALLNDDDLAGESFQARLAERVAECGETFGPATRDTQVVAEMPVESDAGERTLRIARTPLRGDASRGHVWSVRDVTQQKLAEASRDQFIDTATHELRTPLANIKAYAETLATCDMADVEEQKAFCNTINTEATRLARFVDDLLSISSLEVGSLAVERQNVDVRRLLEESAEKVAPLMKQRSLKFQMALAEKLGEAALDKDKVSGLVVNLLGNAAKYTPEGGEVAFSAVRNEGSIVIEVRDTGVGISEEEQAKVFDKFFRSDNPDVRDKVGTGLGLSLAREIARQHRGDLTVESTLGEVSTFTASLPVS